MSVAGFPWSRRTTAVSARRGRRTFSRRTKFHGLERLPDEAHNSRRQGVAMETKKLIGVLILVIGSVAGCATSPAGRALRGTVLSTSPGTRAIVRGPTTMHVYAGFSGGELYNATAETGTDADCA